MARIPFIGGAYSAKSIIANAQRCINVYPERNSKDAPAPITIYERAGFRPLVSAEDKVVRGIYLATNEVGYCVIGQSTYRINADWSLTLKGTLLTPLTTPVAMQDNGIDLVICDGSPFGYIINLATDVFTQLVDPSGLFKGATTVATIDTFTLFNIPGTEQWISTLSNVITFDPTYIASKSNYPGPLIGLCINRHEILLLGRFKSEIWYDAGNAQFPFAELPGASIEHGCIAPYSISTEDINAYWLGQDLQGQGIVFKQAGYQTKRISNHALEFAIQQYSRIDDAIGYTYQQDGHVFYVLCFPTGNATWVYDASIGDPDQAWHQRAWTDANGLLHRDRSNCHAFINGKHVVGDWENGTLYHLDPNYYFDTVNGVDFGISRIRGLPHITTGLKLTSQGMASVDANGDTMQFKNFVVDMECGVAQPAADGSPAQISLLYSRDRGKTFGNAVMQSAGKPGEYLTQPQWQINGIARDMVFELQWSFNGPGAINGAWIDIMVLNK